MGTMEPRHDHSVPGSGAPCAPEGTSRGGLRAATACVAHVPRGVCGVAAPSAGGRAGARAGGRGQFSDATEGLERPIQY